MRFCKVAILMVGATIIFSGCAGRQHHQGYRTRTHAQQVYRNHAPVQQPPIQHTLVPESSEYHNEYNADPPVETDDLMLEPDGPSQPVPAAPETDVSLKKVQGVSFSRSCAPEPTCATPLDVCAEAEGCATRKSCLDGFLTKTKSFCNLSRLYRKPAASALCAVEAPAASCVQEPSCHSPGSICSPITAEGCTAPKSCLPKFSMPKWFTSCLRKPVRIAGDPCVPVVDGCSSGDEFYRQAPAASLDNTTIYRRSPLAEPLEDPFTQPAPIYRSAPPLSESPKPPSPVPAIPVAPAVPEQGNTSRSVDPMPSPNGNVGNAIPAQDVPPPPAPNTLDPMPSGDQTHVEPSIWPKLRTPQGRIAIVPMSQTSWNRNTDTSNPPAWPNSSPWSTSWQVQ